MNRVELGALALACALPISVGAALVVPLEATVRVAVLTVATLCAVALCGYVGTRAAQSKRYSDALVISLVAIPAVLLAALASVEWAVSPAPVSAGPTPREIVFSSISGRSILVVVAGSVGLGYLLTRLLRGKR